MPKENRSVQTSFSRSARQRLYPSRSTIQSNCPSPGRTGWHKEIRLMRKTLLALSLRLGAHVRQVLHHESEPVVLASRVA